MYASLTASEAAFLVSSSAGCLVVLEEPHSHCHHLKGKRQTKTKAKLKHKLSLSNVLDFASQRIAFLSEIPVMKSKKENKEHSSVVAL